MALEFIDNTRAPMFPPRAPGIPRYSPTAIEDYLMCGERFFQRRVNNVKRFRTWLGVGKGVHVAAEADNRSKLEHDKSISPKEAQDLAVNAYDEESKAGEVIEDEKEINFGRDLAAGGADYYITDASIEIPRPFQIEVPILTSFDTEMGRIQIAGVVDLITGSENHLTVRDLKTGKKKKRDSYAHGRGQLSAYGILLHAQFGKFPQTYLIDSLTHGVKGKWRHDVLSTDRQKEDYLSWWSRVFAVHAAISSGSFPPAPEGSWMCSPAYCEFWDTCKYISSRRRYLLKDGEE